MNNNPLDFVAIDFETATMERFSACAIAIVTVINGHIIEKYYTVIKPPQNKINPKFIDIHHITPEQTFHAPNFVQIYPEIKRRLQGKTVVAHNAGFDASVLYDTMDFYAIPDDLDIIWEDTRYEFNCALDVACREHGIPLDHHDALSDATACALLHLLYMTQHEEPGNTAEQTLEEQTYKREHKQFLPRYDTPDNPFIGLRVVVSGRFYTWTDRDELCDLLEELGARICTNVSKNTDLLVVGICAGDRKIERMNEKIEAGKNAMILNENGIIEMLSSCNLSFQKVDLPIPDPTSLTDTITLAQWSAAYYERQQEHFNK